MRSCRLRASFSQEQQDGGTEIHSPTALLGLACHDALDALVKSKSLFTIKWEKAVEEAWQAAIARVAADAEHESHLADLPGYQIKRVRLRQVAARIRELVGDPDANGVELVTEQWLESKDGRLFGKPDLVIRGEEHRIIDYKSGAITDRETGAVKEAYVRQLQLYAFLEWQTIEDWPASAHLLPFSGRPVEIAVDALACEALAEEARCLLHAFNDAAPGVQPATPSLHACSYCPFSPQCGPFWSACAADWQPELIAVAGIVREIFTTVGGDVTLRVDTEAGNTGADEVILWNLSPRDHPDVASARHGSWVAAVSMTTDADRDVFRLPPWGLLRVDDSSVGMPSFQLPLDNATA